MAVSRSARGPISCTRLGSSLRSDRRAAIGIDGASARRLFGGCVMPAQWTDRANLQPLQSVSRHMLGFGHDLRYAFRLMQRRPGVTAAAVLTFALGIGANTAIFSVINSVLLKPLPYRSADRLIFVSLALNTGFGERTSLPMADFLAWRASNNACEKVAAYTGSDLVAVSGVGETEAVVATAATAQVFDALGVKATIGRLWNVAD